MKSAPANGSRWTCWWETTGCHKRYVCRSSDRANRGRWVLEVHGMMEVTVVWEKVIAAMHVGEKMQGHTLAILLRRLKNGIAGIAAAKSSQQFGREEEKE